MNEVTTQQSPATASDDKFTVFIRQADGRGTTYITSVIASSVEEAKALAKEECSREWSVNGSPWAIEDLTVLGVARGDVEIIEWEDTED